MGARDTAMGGGGLIGSLRTIGATLAEMVSVRGSLLAVELQEEVERRKRMLLLAALAFAAFHMALLVVTLLVVAVFWDSYRIASVGALALAYLACGTVALRQLRRDALSSPSPFEASLREFQRDLADLSGRR
jgi:uncharacterized membrane protein YqjE